MSLQMAKALLQGLLGISKIDSPSADLVHIHYPGYTLALHFDLLSFKLTNAQVGLHRCSDRRLIMDSCWTPRSASTTWWSAPSQREEMSGCWSGKSRRGIGINQRIEARQSAFGLHLLCCTTTIYRQRDSSVSAHALIDGCL
jgi:hypothetical protein